MSRRCCWGGHLFASNVGVLPTEPNGCTLDARLVMSVPRDEIFGRKKKYRKRRRKALLSACCPNETNDVAPTIDARSTER